MGVPKSLPRFRILRKYKRKLSEQLTPETARKLRLLVVIASFGRQQDKYLEQIVAEYRSMPYETDIVVTSNVIKPVPEGVDLVVGLPTGDPWSLPWAHQKIMAERIDRYDLFIYSENDVLIQQKNIEAFLRVSQEMPEKELPGFLLYEKGPTGITHYVGAYGHFHWEPFSVCQHGQYTFAFLTNEHSACYLLTLKQLQTAIWIGRYLVPPHKGKYDLACTASTIPYTLSGFRKLICISHLEEFMVRHLPCKYTGPEFQASDQAFDKQLNALSRIHRNQTGPVSLLETDSKIRDLSYSKSYYEPVRQKVVTQIPVSVRSLLSIGAGSGKTEKYLQDKGLQVTAVPLDPVIGSCLDGSGVELIYGDMAAVRTKLEGRKFDCLFLSNILHLLPRPAQVLESYAELLEPEGYVLIVTPNVASLKNGAYGLMGRAQYRDLRNYERGGVQYVSKGNLSHWIEAAGLKMESLNWVATPKFEKVVRLSGRILGPMFAAEMIALARKKR